MIPPANAIGRDKQKVYFYDEANQYKQNIYDFISGVYAFSRFLPICLQHFFTTKLLILREGEIVNKIQTVS